MSHTEKLDDKPGELFKTYDLVKVDGKLKILDNNDLSNPGIIQDKVIKVNRNLDNNTSSPQKKTLKELEGEIDDYLIKLKNNQENIIINNNIQNENDIEFGIDNVKNSLNSNNEEIKKNNDKNFSNACLKAEYNNAVKKANTEPKDKDNQFENNFNNLLELKSSVNSNADKKANTEPKAKYDQLWNKFNNLPERKLSVNSNASKKEPSKSSSTGAGDCFGCFRNCF